MSELELADDNDVSREIRLSMTIDNIQLPSSELEDDKGEND